MKTITLSFLKEKKACEDGIEWFNKNFGNEANVDKVKELLIKEKQYNWLEWLGWLYENAELTGEFKWYYDNGQLRKHCFYKNGKVEGEYKLYYENGQLWEHCFYKDGNITEVK